MTPETVLQQLNWRYAVKAFDPDRKIPDDVWHALEQSLVLAPSSFGLQPWKFFVIDDPDVRQQLLPHSWGQKQVVDASHMLVLAIRLGINADDVDRYLARMAEVQGTPVEKLEGFGKVVKGFLTNPPFPFEVDSWSTRQVYIALGQFMTAAAMLEIDTCPMEGFMPDKYDEVLGLKEQGYHAVVACPVGYRSPDDKAASRPKVRYEASEVLTHI